MGGCENYGPFWGTLNNKCGIIIGIQKGALVLTTTHMRLLLLGKWDLTAGQARARLVQTAVQHVNLV